MNLLRGADQGVQKLYVGNVSFDSTAEDLRELFGAYGKVTDVYMPADDNGASRGFAFITMAETEYEAALEGVNDTEFMGRILKVRLPLPPGEKAPRRNSKYQRQILNIAI